MHISYHTENILYVNTKHCRRYVLITLKQFTNNTIYSVYFYLRAKTLKHFFKYLSSHVIPLSAPVPAPRHLTLERQLNKSVLIGWNIPEPPGCNQIESYHVYVDGVLKVTVKANERTRALVEGVDSNRVCIIK